MSIIQKQVTASFATSHYQAIISKIDRKKILSLKQRISNALKLKNILIADAYIFLYLELYLIALIEHISITHNYDNLKQIWHVVYAGYFNKLSENNKIEHKADTELNKINLSLQDNSLIHQYITEILEGEKEYALDRVMPNPQSGKRVKGTAGSLKEIGFFENMAPVGIKIRG